MGDTHGPPRSARRRVDEDGTLHVAPDRDVATVAADDVHDIQDDGDAYDVNLLQGYYDDVADVDHASLEGQGQVAEPIDRGTVEAEEPQ